MTRRAVAAAALLAAAIAVPRQAAAQESQFAADLRREGEHIAESCGFSLKGVAMCTYSLITETPFHVALGNLPPQNGFAVGPAFTEHYTPNESWRLSFGADTVRAFGGSWRAGASMKMVHTPATSGVVVAAPGTSPGGGTIRPRQFTVIDIAWQTISLRQVAFYGLGPDSLEADRTVYGEQHSTLGASVIYPLGNGALRPSLLGGIAGRWIDIRPGHPDDGPSIETRFDETTAPGLTRQDAFLELNGGVRIAPSLGSGRVNLNYLVRGQYFHTSAAAAGTFGRWTIDLRHEIPLYRQVTSTGPRDFNGPNDCGTSVANPRCPEVSLSRNRTGAITLRALGVTSTTSDANQVPFYLQRTIGGSDLNGERLVAGFDDYRFRAPHLIAFQEGIEHSLWGPIGLFAQAEQGSVALRRGDLGRDFVTSASVGFTIRAGGAPAIVLAYSWSSEGHHGLATVDATLIGGGARPSLH